MKQLLVSLLVLGVVSGTAFGEQQPEATTADKGHAEIGGVVGYPVGVGLVVGYWGPRKFPVVARLATGVGTTIELGMGFANEDNLLAYASLQAGVIGYLGVLNNIKYYIGPSVGLRVNKLFSMGIGPAVRFEAGQAAALSMMAYVGISGMF